MSYYLILIKKDDLDSSAYIYDLLEVDTLFNFLQNDSQPFTVTVIVSFHTMHAHGH